MHIRERKTEEVPVWSFTVPWGETDAALGPSGEAWQRAGGTSAVVSTEGRVSRIRVCIVSVGPGVQGPRGQVSGHGVSVVGGWGCGLELLEKGTD